MIRSADNQPFDDDGPVLCGCRVGPSVNMDEEKVTATKYRQRKGDRKAASEPGVGMFTYSYDSAGRLSFLNNPDGHRATYTYDAADRRVRKQLANGTSASMAYDAAGRLTVVANMISMTPNQFDYTYDNVGNRVGVAFFSVDTTTDWTYDATYQLINEALVGPGPFNTTYVYDPVGNRLVKNDSGALTTNTYDAANQLLTSVAAAGTTTYAFDAAGNQLTESAPTGITTSTWDDENRRTAIILPSAVINTAVYNGDNLRVEKQDSTGTTMLIWDGRTYLEETDGSNVTNAIYTVEPTKFGQVISQTRKSGSTWTPGYYHYDGLGSTVRLSSSTKSTLASYAYKAFGEMTGGSGGATPVNPFRFIGQLGYYFDADLLDNYVRARWYRPVIARWLSADPVGFLAFDINVFRYVMNNAANAVDPNGLGPVCCTFDNGSTIWSETYDCQRFFNLGMAAWASACCKWRASGFLYSWKALASRAGRCPPPPPPVDRCAGDWKKMDWLDCVSCCIDNAYGVTLGAATVWCGMGGSRVPKHKVWPGQKPGYSWWSQKWVRRIFGNYTYRTGQVIGVTFRRAFLILGLADAAVVTLCSSYCLPPGRPGNFGPIVGPGEFRGPGGIMGPKK